MIQKNSTMNLLVAVLCANFAEPLAMQASYFIVTANAGYITVESEGGIGSKFIIKLPVNN